MGKGVSPRALEVVDICRKGSYLVSNNEIKFGDKMFECMKETFYVPASKSYVAPVQFSGLKTFENSVKIELTGEKTVDTIFRLRDMQNVGVLNFASARKAGGGFMTGAQAQEESLCLCSGLYSCLTTEEGRKYYAENDKEHFACYTDAMIYSSKVPFFKNSQNQNVDYVCVDVLTCPAINRGVLMGTVNTAKNIDVYDAKMRDRMFKCLCLFKERGCKTLILGAFGCGVFGNHPATISKNWFDLLSYYDFGFEHIVFAVYDRPPNMSCFNHFSAIWGKYSVEGLC